MFWNREAGRVGALDQHGWFCDRVRPHSVCSTRSSIVVALAMYYFVVTATAWADEGEASLGARLIAGTSWVHVGTDGSQKDRVPIGGFELEGTVATKDWYAYCLSLSYVGHGRLGRYVAMDAGAASGVRDVARLPLMRRDRLVRLGLGITLRPTPPPWTATFHMGLGGAFDIGGEDEAADVGQWGMRGSHAERGRFDLFGKVALGVDYRIDAHWMIGSALMLEQGVKTWGEPRLSATFHVSYYWYPRWYGRL